MTHGIQYRIRKGVVIARLGDVSIFALQQAINNAEVSQANAESTGDAAGAAAANALANSLHAQMAAIYANATPPDKQAQVSYVLTATAPTAPVVIAAPPPPPPVQVQPAPQPAPIAPVNYAPAPATSQPPALVPLATVAAPAPNPTVSLPWWVWAIAGSAALYFVTK